MNSKNSNLYLITAVSTHSTRPALMIHGDGSSPPFPSKKQKVSVAEKEPEEEEVKQIVDRVNIDEEEDWLPPSQKISNEPRNLNEDSTSKELRLKKQELISLTQSAEDVVRNIEASFKWDLSALVKSSSDTVAAPPSKPLIERAKIIISIQDKDELQHFRVYMDDKFRRIFKMYADKAKLDVQNLVFSFDGDKISHTATPEGLGMEDNDIIEVHAKSSRSGILVKLEAKELCLLPLSSVFFISRFLCSSFADMFFVY